MKRKRRITVAARLVLRDEMRGEGAANWWENGGLVGTASAEKNSPILWVGVPKMESKYDIITLRVCFYVISLKERTSKSRFKAGQREQREHRVRQSSSSYGVGVELIVSYHYPSVEPRLKEF